MTELDIRDFPKNKWTMTHFEAVLIDYKTEHGEYPDSIIITPLHLGELFNGYNHYYGEDKDVDSFPDFFEGLSFKVKR